MGRFLKFWNFPKLWLVLRNTLKWSFTSHYVTNVESCSVCYGFACACLCQDCTIPSNLYIKSCFVDGYGLLNGLKSCSTFRQHLYRVRQLCDAQNNTFSGAQLGTVSFLGEGHIVTNRSRRLVCSPPSFHEWISRAAICVNSIELRKQIKGSVELMLLRNNEMSCATVCRRRDPLGRGPIDDFTTYLNASGSPTDADRVPLQSDH